MRVSFASNLLSVNEVDFPRLALLQVISLIIEDLLITKHGYDFYESRIESFIMIQSTFCLLSYSLQNAALKIVGFVRRHCYEESSILENTSAKITKQSTSDDELNKLSLKLNDIKSIAKLNESKRMLLVKTLYKEKKENARLQKLLDDLAMQLESLHAKNEELRNQHSETVAK